MNIYQLHGLTLSAEPHRVHAALRRVVSVAACVVGCCFVAAPADSSTMYWTGGRGNWNTDEYWIVGDVGDQREPRADDDVRLGSPYRPMAIVIVDRAGEVARRVIVGVQEAATLQIEDNGELTTFQTDIGGSPYGGEGSVSVTGPNASWTNEAELTVGAFNPYISQDYLDLPGWLTVSEGGVVSSGSGLIGSSQYSDGWAHVDGAGSLWSNQGDIVVGADGYGDLRVSRGGRVSSEKGILGQDSIYGSGTATVTGALSRWDSRGELRVGGSGIGALSIERGGVVSNELGTIGRFSGASGTVKVNGAFSTWSSSGDTIIGVRGSGALRVSDGGTVLTHGDGIVGMYESSGSVSVSGEGSSWDVANNLHLGYLSTNAFKKGSLRVQSGGTVYSAALYVGYGGQGLLSVLSGGTISSAAGYIGFEGGATGEVTVTGDGSTWTNADVLYVGGSGNGELNIESGGAVTNTTGYLAQQAGTTGEVTVTGPGSSWIQSGRLNVGLKGHGTLLIADGGRVESDWAGITVEAGSTGEATITGVDSEWIAERLYVGGGGTGSLDVLNGGRFETPTFITIWGFGAVNLDGGTIDAETINHTSGGVFDFLDGTLNIGTFNGSLEQQGGTLARGHSPGTLTITGDYSLDAGALEVKLIGDGGIAGIDADFVDVAGTATLGGELVVDLLGGFEPSAIDSFTVLSAGELSGAFANVVDGARLLTTGGEGSFLVSYNGTTNKVVLSNFLAGIPGDYDLDGDVDGSDFLTWQRNPGVDGLIDWQKNFGNLASFTHMVAVPEPTSWTLLAVVATCLPLCRLSSSLQLQRLHKRSFSRCETRDFRRKAEGG